MRKNGRGVRQKVQSGGDWLPQLLEHFAAARLVLRCLAELFLNPADLCLDLVGVSGQRGASCFAVLGIHPRYVAVDEDCFVAFDSQSKVCVEGLVVVVET